MYAINCEESKQHGGESSSFQTQWISVNNMNAAAILTNIYIFLFSFFLIGSVLPAHVSTVFFWRGGGDGEGRGRITERDISQRIQVPTYECWQDAGTSASFYLIIFLLFLVDSYFSVFWTRLPVTTNKIKQPPTMLDNYNNAANLVGTFKTVTQQLSSRDYFLFLKSPFFFSRQHVLYKTTVNVSFYGTNGCLWNTEKKWKTN